MKSDFFDDLKNAVEKELSCSAHDMDHVFRVYNMSVKLATGEDVDMDVVKAAALLHDVARVREDKDSTGSTDHALLGADMSGEILESMGFPKEKIPHVKDCIISHRYRTGNEPKTKEAGIIFDADKLDVVGAIGIARSFTWGGKHNARIYNDVDLDEYIKKNLGGKINGRIMDKSKHCPHIDFETKVKFIENKLHSEKAKKICRDRIRFFKKFLDRLEKEIRGEL